MESYGNDDLLLTAAAVGAISGLRSTAAPALLTYELAGDAVGPAASGLEAMLTSKGVARGLTFVAGLEMVADKAPFTPDRTDPGPLIGRALLGSLTAAALAAHRRQPVALPALVGAAAAVGSAFAAFHLRRYAGERLNVPDRLLGLVEDAVVIGAARALGSEIDL